MIAKGVSDVDMVNGMVTFYNGYNDYEDGLFTKIDAQTGKYLGKFKGGL